MRPLVLLLITKSASDFSHCLQVPVPTGNSAIQWLRGQKAGQRRLPSVYFSPRRSSAPSTAGMVAAGSTSVGIEAVAGAQPLSSL